MRKIQTRASVIYMNLAVILPIAFTILAVSACGSDTSTDAPNNISVGQITWSDGDSGEISNTPFRLSDVDAPETGGVGSSFGGADCEQERVKGFLARDFIVSLTAQATISITANYGTDRYGRNVVDLNADGIDVAAAGIEAGHLKPWPHDSNGNAITNKPDWCNR